MIVLSSEAEVVDLRSPHNEVDHSSFNRFNAEIVDLRSPQTETEQSSFNGFNDLEYYANKDAMPEHTMETPMSPDHQDEDLEYVSTGDVMTDDKHQRKRSLHDDEVVMLQPVRRMARLSQPI